MSDQYVTVHECKQLRPDLWKGRCIGDFCVIDMMQIACHFWNRRIRPDEAPKIMVGVESPVDDPHCCDLDDPCLCGV
jgi:hypothetical protein